jgi:hypothetical protein
MEVTPKRKAANSTTLVIPKKRKVDADAIAQAQKLQAELNAIDSQVNQIDRKIGLPPSESGAYCLLASLAWSSLCVVLFYLRECVF